MWKNHFNLIGFKPWEWVGDDGDLHGVRILGVLQRIAVCYLFASLIVYFFKPKGVYIISIGLLLVYWGLCYWLGQPGSPYSLQGYFGVGVDKAILHDVHMYHGEGWPLTPKA